MNESTDSKSLGSKQFESDKSAYGYKVLQTATTLLIITNIYLVYFMFILVIVWSHADTLTTEIPCVQG